MGHGTIGQCIIESLMISLWGCIPPRFNSSSLETLRESYCGEYGSPRSTGNSLGVSLRDSSGLEYFDSYGMKPFFPEILNFIDRHQSRPVWNPFDYQALNTTVCDQYCVYNLLQRHKRKKTGPRVDVNFSHVYAFASRLLHCQVVSRKVSPPPPPHYYGQKCQCLYENPPHI